MKKWLLLLLAAVVVTAVFLFCNHDGVQPAAVPPSATSTPVSTNAVTPSGPVVRVHFAGADFISSDTNSLAFTNEFTSLEARALESQTLDKLSRAPGVWFKKLLPSGAGGGSAQLRPLLDDFLKSEWVFEMHDAPASPEYALAIRLNDARAQLWQTNLRSLLESWTKINARDITNGWELKKDMPPNLFRIVRAGDWLVLGCGQDELPWSDHWCQPGGMPQRDTNWLSADLDWPRLGQLFPVLAKFDFPVIHMQVNGRFGDLQATGTLDLSKPLSPLDKWQIPSEIIHQPITSFTAARGFAPWLTNQSWAEPLEITPQPGQLFTWSLPMPLQTFIAVPVQDAANALAQLGQSLAVHTNWQSRLGPLFHMDITSNQISLRGTPFIAPQIQALHEPSGDYLFGNVFPNTMRGKGLPENLSKELERDNLVYYHWEITSMRLKALPQLTQLGLMLTRHRQLQGDSVAGKWLDRFGPALSPSVTEVIQTGPQELSFLRSAQGGLTAVELIALANWLEAPNFPGCDLNLPPPRLLIGHRPMKKLSAPLPLPAPAPSAPY